MISWLFLAIGGHLLNGIAFVIDKALLTSSFKHSATYASLIGILSSLFFLGFPWVRVWPSSSIGPYVFGFGAFFVLGLWAFFESLKREEASRIVPIVGSLVPIVTLLGAYTLLDERLTPRSLIGFGLLLIATWVFTGGSFKQHSRIQRTSFILSLLAAIAFATATISGKYAFDHGEFLSVLLASRLAAGCVGLLIALFVQGTRKELAEAFFQTSSKQSLKHAPARSSSRTIAWTLTAQLSGAGGFFLVNAALARGSAPLVNALQAIQYGTILLIAVVGGRTLQHKLHESVDGKTLMIKAIGILITAGGLWCIIV